MRAKDHHRRAENVRRSRTAQPHVEGLEVRQLLYATYGGSWVYPNRITYSFIPDGANIAGSPSDLYADMNAKFGSPSAWQQQIQRAAAVWEAVANINLALVPDDGSPLAADGAQQGDPRFGDIRIGGITLGGTTLAMAFSSPPIEGGSLAGDIVFSTEKAWQINGAAYDLQSVAIHEFGHALGMSHSAINAAVMWPYYTVTKQALTTDDTNGIVSIYGASPPDLFDSIASNQTQATATNLSSYIDAQGRLSMPHLRLSSASDLDYYKLVAPASTNGTLTVTVQTAGLSSMSPQVWLINSSSQILGKALAPKSYGSTATVAITGVVAGQTYYVRVVGADTGPSGQGGYGLLANFGAYPLDPIAPDPTYVAEQPDQPGPPGGYESIPVPGKKGAKQSDVDHGSVTLGTLKTSGDVFTVQDAVATSRPTVSVVQSALPKSSPEMISTPRFRGSPRFRAGSLLSRSFDRVLSGRRPGGTG